jgi:pyridoxamine 5'-phosphate oxidase
LCVTARQDSTKYNAVMNEQQSGILTAQWATLVRGAVDSKHDWHWPVMGTIGRLASDTTPWPQLRTVVLRKTYPHLRRLEVHSDSRAGKLLDIAQQPQVMMHFYEQRSRTQLRLACHAVVHQDDAISEDAWNKLPPSSQTQYLDGPTLTMTQQHFAVIHLEVRELEWLWLAREGHQRTKFVYQSEHAAEQNSNAHWSAQDLKP